MSMALILSANLLSLTCLCAFLKTSTSSSVKIPGINYYGITLLPYLSNFSLQTHGRLVYLLPSDQLPVYFLCGQAFRGLRHGQELRLFVLSSHAVSFFSFSPLVSTATKKALWLLGVGSRQRSRWFLHKLHSYHHSFS